MFALGNVEEGSFGEREETTSSITELVQVAETIREQSFDEQSLDTLRRKAREMWYHASYRDTPPRGCPKIIRE